MGFWSGLGKVLSVAAPIAAIPFTGGASALGLAPKALSTGAKIMNGIGAGAQAAGALASGREAGREAANTAAGNADRLRLQAMQQREQGLENRAQLALDQGKDARAASADNYHNALLSSLALNAQDSHFDRPRGVPDSHSTGGLRPSALGAQGHAAAEALNSQALQALLNPSKASALPDMQMFTPTEMQKGGAIDNILGGIGLGGAALSGYKSMNQSDENQSLIRRLAEQDKKPTDVTAAPSSFGQE